jgi:hypothetical protein
MIHIHPPSLVSPKTALDIPLSFVRKHWGHFNSEPVICFDSCALLPVVDALLLGSIVNVSLVDLMALVLVSVVIVGGGRGGNADTEKELMAE